MQLLLHLHLHQQRLLQLPLPAGLARRGAAHFAHAAGGLAVGPACKPAAFRRLRTWGQSGWELMDC